MTSPASTPDARARLLELLRFAAVGATSTLIYFAVYSLAVLQGLPYGVAQLLAWLLSVGFGFVMHHRFTFRTGHGGFTGDGGFWRWMGLQGFVMLLNFGGLTALVHGVGLSRIAAQLVLLPFIPLLTYVLSRRFIFKPQPTDPLRIPTV